MRAVGKEYSRQKNSTSLMNFLKPVTANNHDKIINKLVKTTTAVAKIACEDACEELRADSTYVIKYVLKYLLMEHGNAEDILH